MTFATPQWLWALVILLSLLALRIRSHLTRKNNLSGLVAPRLNAVLIKGTSQTHHWLTFGFAFLALAMIILALARPRWGFEEVESFTEGRSVILAIDTSRSMLATDLIPNRLERAKLAARDIVEGLGEDRIGLIAFAGKSFMQAPLTTDHQAVIESIEQLDTEIIPRGGTNLTEAAKLALDSFRETSSEQNALIIFSDGEALEGQEQVMAIRAAANREKMIIITIGVGTANGSVIPEPGEDGRPQTNSFIKDENGQVVRTRLDATALRELASGGGTYLPLGEGGSLTQVVQSIIETLKTTREEDAARQRPVERFMIPLGLGLIFLIFSHLVPFLFSNRWKRLTNPATAPAKNVALFCLCLTISSSAFGKDGWDYIDREEFDTALTQFEQELSGNPKEISRRRMTGIQLGIGLCAYKIGDYEKATQSFGKAMIRSSSSVREQAHYNLGNTLFRVGETILKPSNKQPDTPAALSPSPEAMEAALRQWLGSLEHYEAALRLNSHNADTQHNIEVLKKQIANLKKEMGLPPDKEEASQDKEKKGDQKKDKDSKAKDDQKKEDPKDPNQPDPSENSNPSQSRDDSNPNKDQSPENDPNQNNEPEKNAEPEPPAPENGKLSTNESESRPNPKKIPENRTNPDTGYSPSQARQLIEALADEDVDLRPAYAQPVTGERYKNW